MILKFDGRPQKKQLGSSSILHQALCIISNNRWIQTGVTVRKHSIRVKIGNFLSRVTLKYDWWHWKIIGHLFYTMKSHVHHFKAMGEFKFELQSGSAQFGSKSAIFSPCDLKIWWIILKNNRIPLLFYIKLCASFWSHRCIQNWVTVWKRPICVKIGDILSCVTLKFDGWPWKTTGLLVYTTSRFMHHFIAISGFKLELQPGNAQVESKSANFCPVWPSNLTDEREKFQGTSSMILQAVCIISYPLVNSNFSYSPETPNLGQKPFFNICV